MKEEVKPDWDLAAKYLAGESNKEEQERISTWENADPGNQTELDKAGNAWTLSASGENLYKINDDKVWAIIKSKIVELDKEKLEKLWISGEAPWKVWND